MRKIVFIALLLAFAFLFAEPTNAQSLIQTEYDKFKDKTTVSTKEMQLTGTLLRGVQLRLIAFHEGKVIATPKEVGIAIVSTSETGRFSDDKELIFLLDDVRLKLGSMVTTSREYKNETYIEILVLPSTMETIKKINNAIIVEGKIGSLEFKLTPEHKAIIKMFFDYFAEKK